MTDQPLFFLMSIVDDSVWDHWTFRAPDELAVMRHLLRYPWDYDGLFWGLRISPREIDQLTPEQLGKAIENSYGSPRCRAVIHLIRVNPNEVRQVAETVSCAGA